MFWMFDMGPRGPMHGHRGFGPMAGAPRRHMYGPHMGYRPLIRPGLGFGGLFLLPALLFGGWIAVAAVGMALSVAATVIGGVFSALASVVSGVFSGAFSGAFSGGSIALGVIIGLVAFYALRKRNARTDEQE